MGVLRRGPLPLSSSSALNTLIVRSGCIAWLKTSAIIVLMAPFVALALWLCMFHVSHVVTRQAVQRL